MDARTVRKIEKYNQLKNTIKGDMTIVGHTITREKGINIYKIVFKCNVCGREKELHERCLTDSDSAFNHKNCMLLVPRDDHFHSKYKGMIKRINNPKYENYARYGGRGLTCDYENYIDFYDDFYEEYLEHCKIHGMEETTIERIDFNKGYTKDNITFATRKQQANNRCTSWINVQGRKIDSQEWFNIENLSDFCKENDLWYANAIKCLTKPKKVCQGYYFKGERIE